MVCVGFIYLIFIFLVFFGFLFFVIFVGGYEVISGLGGVLIMFGRRESKELVVVVWVEVK